MLLSWHWIVFCGLFLCKIQIFFILKVYIYSPCINSQRWSTAPFNNTPVISPPNRKHWKTGLYQGSYNCCERYCDSNLNHLFSVILRKYTTVTNIISDSPGPERDIFSILIVDLISRSTLVRFILLRVSYNLTGFVCYVYLVYNL